MYKGLSWNAIYLVLFWKKKKNNGNINLLKQHIALQENLNKTNIHIAGQNGDILFSAKSSSKMPYFWNYLGICPCFETRFSKNWISM